MPDKRLHMIDTRTGRQLPIGEKERYVDFLKMSETFSNRIAFQTTIGNDGEFPAPPDLSKILPAGMILYEGENFSKPDTNEQFSNAEHVRHLKSALFATIGTFNQYSRELLVAYNDKIHGINQTRLWQYDMDTGEEKLITTIDQDHISFLVDDNLKPYAAIQEQSNPGLRLNTVRILAPSRYSQYCWEEVFAATGRENEIQYGTNSKDFKSVYLIDGRRGSDRKIKRIFLEDADRVEIIASGPDITSVLPNYVDRGQEWPDILGYITEGLIPTLHVTQERYKGISKIFSFYYSGLKGEHQVIPMRVSSALSYDGKFFIQPLSPDSYTLFSLPAFTKIKELSIEPHQPGLDLATKLFKAACPVIEGSVISKDNFTIPYYFTKPRDGKTPYPTMVEVHGGPALRDDFVFDPQYQSLAECLNVATLQVNFRGSKGFGKEYEYAGDGNWDKVLDDILLVTDTLIENGTIDPKRLIISGGSFGGYATYAMLSFRPGKFIAGIALNGLSNLVQAIYEQEMPFSRAHWQRLMGGNPDIPVENRKLKELSPLHCANRINVPLMSIVGVEDEVVNPEQTKSMVNQVMQAKCCPALIYIEIINEGHSLINPKNYHAYMALQHGFVAQQFKLPIDPAVTKAITDATDVIFKSGAEHLNFIRRHPEEENANESK